MMKVKGKGMGKWRGKRRGRERVRVKGLRITAFYNGCKSRAADEM